MNRKIEKSQLEITPSIGEDLKTMREYVKGLTEKQNGFHLVAVEAFVRGMRDSGYKSTATALEDLIDNSFEANAQRIDIVYEEKKGSMNTSTC